MRTNYYLAGFMTALHVAKSQVLAPRDEVDFQTWEIKAVGTAGMGIKSIWPSAQSRATTRETRTSKGRPQA
jgi:hypothetical protein